MTELELNAWSDFGIYARLLIDFRKSLRQKMPGGASNLLFRGQSDASWHLSDTLERATKEESISVINYYNTIFSVKPEIELFTGQSLEEMSTLHDFKRKLSHKPDVHPHEFPAYEYLIYLRHHDFPSPLLDWTRSEYIAAFFAYDQIPEAAKRVAIYVFLERVGYAKNWTDAEPFITTLGQYRKADRRHFLQQAEYSVCTHFYAAEPIFVPHEFAFRKETNKMPIEDFAIQMKSVKYHEALLERMSQDLLWKVTLPVSERDTVLEDLGRMNINAFTLFGSEESLMRTIGRREFGSD